MLLITVSLLLNGNGLTPVVMWLNSKCPQIDCFLIHSGSKLVCSPVYKGRRSPTLGLSVNNLRVKFSGCMVFWDSVVFFIYWLSGFQMIKAPAHLHILSSHLVDINHAG